MLMKIAKLLLPVIAMLVTSCNRSDDQGLGGSSSFRLNLAADATTLTVQTKAAEPSLTPEMFKVRVEDSEFNVLRTWDKFTDMPAPTRINEGSYRIVAWHGSNELPAWDNPYYEGTASFTIVKGETKDINLTCTLAATKVQVNFDESFNVHYSSYSVDIRTSQTESEFLNFDPQTQGRSAYFTPGTMNIRFRLTSKADGQTYFFSPTPIANTAARESYTLNMSAKVTQGIGTITIITNEATNDKPIEIIIPRN